MEINLDELTKVTKRLITIIKNENALLAEFNIKNVEELQQQKLELSAYLENCHKILKDNPKLLENFDKAKKLKALKAYETLQLLSKENIDKINRATIANSKILQLIKNAIVENMNSLNGYNCNGSYGGKFRSEPEIPALTIMLNNI
jgi:hypothetical protein